MEQALIYVWSGLGGVIGTLVLVAVMVWASKTTLRQLRDLWHVVRGHRDDLMAGVDQPTDPLIRALARLTGLPPTVWTALLSELMRSLADGLDTMLEESPASDTAKDYFETTTQT